MVTISGGFPFFFFFNRVHSLAREELTSTEPTVALSQHIIVCVNGYDKRSVMSHVQLKKTVKKKKSPCTNLLCALQIHFNTIVKWRLHDIFHLGIICLCSCPTVRQWDRKSTWLKWQRHIVPVASPQQRARPENKPAVQDSALTGMTMSLTEPTEAR